MPKPGYLTFRVDPENLVQLQAIAKEKGYKVGQLARMCLRDGLKLAPGYPVKPTQHEVHVTRATA